MFARIRDFLTHPTTATTVASVLITAGVHMLQTAHKDYTKSIASLQQHHAAWSQALATLQASAPTAARLADEILNGAAAAPAPAAGVTFEDAPSGV